jgi:hypothetical protein
LKVSPIPESSAIFLVSLQIILLYIKFKNNVKKKKIEKVPSIRRGGSDGGEVVVIGSGLGIIVLTIAVRPKKVDPTLKLS